MIPDRDNKVKRVVKIIRTRSAEVKGVFGRGPKLHFYHRVRSLRSQHPCVRSFLLCDTCVEILYATLVSWDMTSRRARMKDYGPFRGNLQDNIPKFQQVENELPGFTWGNHEAAVQALSLLYDDLDMMETRGVLVSNSKCLHFVFPGVCPPMDRTNTLTELYGNGNESKEKFLEILEFSYDVLSRIGDPLQYCDDQWNTCATKLVDNAISLM